MASATAQDQIDFEALPEATQALARRVLEVEADELYDEGYRDGYTAGCEKPKTPETKTST